MAFFTVAAVALDNGLGLRPGLGWNSDYCTNCTHPPGDNGFGGEHFVSLIAHYMAEVPQPGGANRTLQALGFHYVCGRLEHAGGSHTLHGAADLYPPEILLLRRLQVNMDASWDLPNRDGNGQLVPDPHLWPSGLAHTVTLVHSLGLGFGLYGDRGTMDCAKNPGNKGHVVSDAKQYAAWDIDWYKTDNCYTDRSSHAEAIEDYSEMRDALNATGKQIWLALCGWANWYAPPDPTIRYGGGKTLGNSWRSGPDTGTGWTAVIT